MNRLVFYGVLSSFFFSCSTNRKEEQINNALYKISHHQLQVDTVIRDIGYLNQYYLCLQENLKIAVFDSNFVRKKEIEDSLNIFPFSNLYTSNDTIFLYKNEPQLWSWPKNVFYFTKNFKIQSKKLVIRESGLPVNSWPLFEDSTYTIYSNHIGSYGFFVFFKNNQTKKTYVTRSSGPRQVLKFNSKFYIAGEGDYKHSPEFIIVSDPTKLMEISENDAQKLIMHYQHLGTPQGEYYRKLGDSLNNLKLPSYGGLEKRRYSSIPIYSFVRDTSLYTIVKSDSSIYFVIHKKDSLIKIQTILDTSIEMQRISSLIFGNNHFVMFEASGGKMIDNKMQAYSSSGFIFIKDSSIDFLYAYFHRPYDP